MRAVHFPIGTFTRHSECGIALVITLILLSVTLVMAVAFLAISRRERGSVVTETGAVTARLAADSGLASAEAQILATVLQTTNPYNFGLLVSTNYINANGFAPGAVNPTNVNYDHIINSATPLTAAQFADNVANLLYLPRAPVFAYDRGANTNEFRFYLDLNRNGRFDPNGLVPVIGQTGGYRHPNGTENGNSADVVTNFVLGDPEWIGVLERPDAPHGPNNKFLSRYAFIALPAGNTLDLNAIHNEVLNQNLTTADGFLRNQGVGGWEINLAAFLADLNTNEWGRIIGGAGFYQYNQASATPGPNSGAAFDDARALLAYRYNFNYGNLKSFASLFPYYPLTGGAVDLFPSGPVMTNSAMPFYSSAPGIQNKLWPGADNTNHYFALASDLYDPAKTQNGIGAFINRLQFASTNVSTYDRYTFYRLLAQLGTDSAPESGKLNLNFVNVDAGGNIVPDRQTNSIPWQPAQFFTNAADRMLRAYTTRWFQANPSNYLATYYGITNYNYSYVDAYGTHINDPNGIGLTNIPFLGMTNRIPSFGVAEIPVLVNSNFVYRAAVQRVLQLAANIYDATSNNVPLLGGDFPSVFRPLFTRNSFGNVFVTGYTNVTTVISSADSVFSPPFDANQLSVPTLTSIRVNVYGVPWIIGAKKGFPGFNEFSMDSVVTITRKMQVRRSDTTVNATLLATNTAFVFSISNSIGIEYWNSYTNNYNAPLQVVVNDTLSMNLTNEYGFSHVAYFTPNNNSFINPWPGSAWNNDGSLNTNYSNPFYVPVAANVVFLTNSVYQWGGPGGFLPANNAGWQTANTELVMPHFGLRTTNRLQAYILALDKSNRRRVIDYVHFNGPESVRDLNAEIETHLGTGSYGNMWDPALTARGPWGIRSQLGVSQNDPSMNSAYWGTTQQDRNRAIAEIDGFTAFMGGTPTMQVPSGYEAVYNSYLTNTTVQVPYTPTVTAYQYTSWQANDPLVHYLSSDLNFADPSSVPPTGINVSYSPPVVTLPPLLPNIGGLNNRYQPWGKVRSFAGSINNPYDTTVKDPLIRHSDDWAFPTNRLPSVGWLGRIHRGSPWQTVYLKATNIVSMAAGINTWSHWTGNGNAYDATNSAPVQDRILFDLFSTALNDNSARGQLPVNVAAGDTGNPAAGLAAWSAVFSGQVVPTNLAGAYTIINPAGPNLTTNSPLYAIVANINAMRASYTNSPFPVRGGAFKHVGDILSAPALSQSSPFLRGLNITNGEPDALMEWIPQQTMGLLRLSDQPLFVVYSYGQTLAAAPNGVALSGNYAGMITNYQVVAETVTRALVSIEGAPTNVHAVVKSYNILPPD